jgi:hypothetical protein
MRDIKAHVLIFSTLREGSLRSQSLRMVAYQQGINDAQLEQTRKFEAAS